MRAVLVVALALAALLRVALDWQGTTGQGGVLRLSSIGQAMEAAWPKSYLQMVTGWQQSPIPLAWDPVGTTLLSLPLALLLAFIAGLLWIVRPRTATP